MNILFLLIFVFSVSVLLILVSTGVLSAIFRVQSSNMGCRTSLNSTSGMAYDGMEFHHFGYLRRGVWPVLAAAAKRRARAQCRQWPKAHRPLRVRRWHQVHDIVKKNLDSIFFRHYSSFMFLILEDTC